MVILIADKLGDARFGLTPKHPVVQGIKVVAISPGKIRPGQRFEYYGDKDNPPDWASPTDEEGKKMYKAAEGRVKEKASARLARAEKEVARLKELLAEEGTEAARARSSKTRGPTTPPDPNVPPPGAGPPRPRGDMPRPQTLAPGAGPPRPTS